CFLLYSSVLLCHLVLRHPLRSTLFPYTTLFRSVNGKERQRGKGAQMVFSIPAILSYISNIMTLEPGDLILTGTPAGVGEDEVTGDRKSTRLNSSHLGISYAVFCLKKKNRRAHTI